MSERNSVSLPEQDADGGDDLPTYDDLAERQGPNSRFGRWRSWIEKRAAERYADVTPEEFQRRRERGWDPGDYQGQPDFSPTKRDETPTPGSSTSFPPRLHLQTSMKALPSLPVQAEDTIPDPEQPLIAQPLPPTHLGLNQFGSRFLPHTTSPIRTLLPLLGDRILLVGHDDGLSVINMFPQEWGELGLRNKGPGEAEAHRIWTGEGVFQMSLLEVENIGESTPQGVVLFLVGTESDGSKDQDGHRTLRMYNLASLISLAKWTIAQKGARPLDLRRPAHWHPQQSSSKKHKSSGSLARGLKSLMVESPQHTEPASSYHAMIPSQSMPPTLRPPLERQVSADSSWDVVDDLPLRWATDYVPLASAGSRLVNASVLSFDVWRDDRPVRGGALLAVATKTGILLYESPKGQRAFRFVKDFYTPLSPRSISFVQQNVQDTVSRSQSDASGSLSKQTSPSYGHVRLSPVASPSRQRQTSLTQQSVNLGQQLSLFIIFEKKAGLIRVADSQVGEVELYEESHPNRDSLSPNTSLSTGSNRRNRASFDGFGFSKEIKGPWSVPAKVDLPAFASPSLDSLYFLTRGKQTRILPFPLPASLPAAPPLRTLSWQAHPTYVAPRIVPADGAHVLQLIAFGEDGLEVQELSLAFLTGGKDKRREEEPVYLQTDFGGDTGFLRAGGHWHRPYDAPLSRSYSARSAVSVDSLATEEVVARLELDQGVYGWQRRGFEDWRVFWVGGTGAEPRTAEDSD